MITELAATALLTLPGVAATGPMHYITIHPDPGCTIKANAALGNVSMTVDVTRDSCKSGRRYIIQARLYCWYPPWEDTRGWATSLTAVTKAPPAASVRAWCSEEPIMQIGPGGIQFCFGSLKACSKPAAKWTYKQIDPGHN